MRVVFSCFEHKCCGKQLRGRRFEDELSRESSIAVELGKQRAVNYIRQHHLQLPSVVVNLMN